MLETILLAVDGSPHAKRAAELVCPLRTRECLLSRRRSNPFLLGAVIGAVAVQLAILYLPVLQTLFDTQALGPLELALVLVASTAAFVAVELEKWTIRRRSRRSRRSPA